MIMKDYPYQARARHDRETETAGTWTFVGHWESGRVVIEYVIPGDVQDPRIDTGYWDEGLWAASASGATMAEAEATVRAEYEDDEPS